MNYYETLYIVHPALESGRLKDIIISIQSMFESKDIKVLCTDFWGKKKLAYLIDKQQYGSYVLVQLQSSGDNINKINTELEHNPDVLSYLTNRIDESNLLKDSRTLDEQILGSKSSESENSPNKNTKVASSTTKTPEESSDAETPEESSDAETPEESSDAETSEESNDAETSEESNDAETPDADNNNEELTSEDEDGTNK